MTTALVRALGDLAHRAVHPAGCGPRACPTPSVLAERDDGTVVRSGPVVAKAHAADTDTTALAARLRLAAGPGQEGVLLAPLSAAPGAHLTELHGRPVTLWPHGEPVDPGDPDTAPWEEAGALLARLHRTGVRGPLPAMRGPVKAALAVARMRAARPGGPAVAPVLAAWHGLPGWARGRQRLRPAGERTSATETSTWASSYATPPRTAPGCSSTWTTRASATPPGTSRAPPPGTRPGCSRRTSGSASWTPTGRAVAPPYPPTATPGPPWTCRPAR